MQLLHTIIIKKYPRKVLVAKATRAKYYNPNDKLANKYLTDVSPSFNKPDYVGKDKRGFVYPLKPAFIWRKVGSKLRLHDVTIKEDVLKNPSKVGQERWEIIKGQSLFGGTINEHTKAKIVKTLKEFWLPELTARAIPSIESNQYPIMIHYHFDATIDDSSDVDNYALPYYKTFMDSMRDAGIIKNDRTREVNGFKVTINPMDANILNWGQSADDVLTVKIYTNGK